MHNTVVSKLLRDIYHLPLILLALHSELGSEEEHCSINECISMVCGTSGFLAAPILFEHKQSTVVHPSLSEVLRGHQLELSDSTTIIITIYHDLYITIAIVSR